MGAILSKQSIVSMETVNIDTVATVTVVLKQTTLIKSYLSMRYFKRNLVTHLWRVSLLVYMYLNFNQQLLFINIQLNNIY